MDRISHLTYHVIFKLDDVSDTKLFLERYVMLEVVVTGWLRFHALRKTFNIFACQVYVLLIWL